MTTHTPNCPGGTCDDPETTFICDVCGRECAACCGVAESHTCDKCFEIEARKQEDTELAYSNGQNLEDYDL